MTQNIGSRLKETHRKEKQSFHVENKPRTAGFTLVSPEASQCQVLLLHSPTRNPLAKQPGVMNGFRRYTVLITL